MENINIIDISIVVAYLIGCLILGLKRFGKVTTLREYTLGSKPFATSVLIATTFATALSAHRVIGSVGKSYQLGIVFASTVVFIPIGWLITSKLLANNMPLFHQKNLMSLGDIMEHWYGRFAKNLTSIGAIIVTLGITATGSIAIGKMSYYFFGIPELVGVLSALAIITIYATFGGFTSVVVTDVFQFFIFFIAMPIACAIAYRDVGGYEKILEALPASHSTIGFKDLGLFISILIFEVLPKGDIPYVQRALVAKNKYQLNSVFTWTALLMIPLFTFTVLIGFITYIKNPNLETDIVLFHFIKHYLPVGAVGLMIAGILAVIMSTQDSFLNTTSSLVARDVCKQIWPHLNAKQELLIARISCVLLSVLSVFFMLIHKDIMEFMWLIFNFWDPLIITPFVMALIGIRINKKLFFIVTLLTLTAQVITRQIVGVFDTRSLAVGMITSILIILLVSRVNRKQAV